ncbi:hypothetical protein [Myxococcus xanthus]|uniref:hypothetical protein n=1 Tax=Myxococcus xanthus TaxID=34 RepID=UPI00112C7036|nr:hypothetical protein [Myxococcus xanthus]
MRFEVRNHLEASYPKKVYKKLDASRYDLVLDLYGYGCRFRDGRKPVASFADIVGELIWSDAEEFLEYLDVAAAGGPNSAAFKRLAYIISMWFHPMHGPHPLVTKEDAFALSGAAKRLIAGSCSAFLSNVNVDTERWEPFVKWAEQLGGNDTVITFNYDCVPEMLGARSKTIRVVGLGEGRASQSPAARLLKLHGSVDWKVVRQGPGPFTEQPTGDEIVSVETGMAPDFSLVCEDHELAIASPGPLKRAVSAGWLAQLWDLAIESIREADAIVFIGYRFPPSDSSARERLLGAIRRNGSPYLAVHTVLGPDSPDQRRLKQLLRFSLADRLQQPIGKRPESASTVVPSYTFIDHPLYGQDFLSVFLMSWVTDAWRVQPV